MQINQIVRQLTSTDCAMRELNALFSEAFGARETYAAEPPADAYLAERLTSDHVIVLVDGQVAGGLVAFELFKFERIHRAGRILLQVSVSISEPF